MHVVQHHSSASSEGWAIRSHTARWVIWRVLLNHIICLPGIGSKLSEYNPWPKLTPEVKTTNQVEEKSSLDVSVCEESKDPPKEIIENKALNSPTKVGWLKSKETPYDDTIHEHRLWSFLWVRMQYLHHHLVIPITLETLVLPHMIPILAQPKGKIHVKMLKISLNIKARLSPVHCQYK